MRHAYIGDGKGKSTAALGLLIRAAGAGLRGAAVYFDKGCQTYRHHETVILEKLGVPFYIFGCERMTAGGGFRFGVTEDDRREAQAGLRQAENLLTSGSFDLLVLDEILTCASGGLLEWREVEAVLAKASSHVEIVCTGRCRDEAWVAGFDLVSRVTKVRHYFDRGVTARPGIEY
ncbi:MAG: Cob(I)alamin adenosyltransferase [Candidatus Ozemobacter sibiricus]|jgi:cob(I)alamin adenosyltransferase|uniref:Cob(I)alamin adenosyltransferase n=1 Tax=Candidatus Ozemobacter sibiricus TaxID=2268124 RepID=A0A367ZJR4_9BACT|nr:MAG: Cob(I)alamin adenosyltransferase [Candidatus Ozemobacter sibiricus]